MGFAYLTCARAATDGYTLLVATANNFVINQFLMKMSFDPLTALPPIAKVADIPLISAQIRWFPSAIFPGLFSTRASIAAS